MNRKIRPMSITSIVIFTVFLLVVTGCTYDTNRSYQQQSVSEDIYDQQMLNGRNVRSPQQNNVNNDKSVDNRIAIADKAAKEINKIKGIDQANVLITKNNAYVAAVLDTKQSQITRNIEDKIAKQVRAVDPRVRNVYVSTNPEFIDRINAYVRDVREGRPVEGFVDQFSEMVERIFPNAR